MKKIVLLFVVLSASTSCFALAERSVSNPARPFKVLMIGNSFSICNLKQMPHVAKSMGLKLDLASLYIGGCSLERHWNNVVASTNAAFRPYRFDRTTDGVKVVERGKANIPDALVLDKWDVVTIQQASHFSWKPTTYHPFGDSLVAKIRELAPQAKIIVQETWSYPPWDKRLKKFGFNQAEMYTRLHGAYAAFAAKHGLDVIPVGTAAEFVSNRNALFTKPDFHFNREGEYLQGLAFTAKIFGVDVRKCLYRPSWLKAARADEIKKVVMDAVGERERKEAFRCPKMEQRFYPVSDDFPDQLCEAAEDIGEASRDFHACFKAVLGLFDVEWPDGSLSVNVKALGGVRVLNTPQNHAKIEAALKMLDAKPHAVELDCRFVEAGREALAAAGYFATNRVDGAALLSRLMARDDVYAWRAPVKAGGAQIDMVIDRGDRMINVCEMKYKSEDYSFSLASRATQMAR